MNTRRVIGWMTVGVCIVLGWLMIAVFGDLPPWPVIASFCISHVFFCIVIMGVKPYRGPYSEPTAERSTDEWDEA
jgi:hypothetical protein